MSAVRVTGSGTRRPSPRKPATTRLTTSASGPNRSRTLSASASTATAGRVPVRAPSFSARLVRVGRSGPSSTGGVNDAARNVGSVRNTRSRRGSSARLIRAPWWTTLTCPPRIARGDQSLNNLDRGSIRWRAELALEMGARRLVAVVGAFSHLAEERGERSRVDDELDARGRYAGQSDAAFAERVGEATQVIGLEHGQARRRREDSRRTDRAASRCRQAAQPRSPEPPRRSRPRRRRRSAPEDDLAGEKVAPESLGDLTLMSGEPCALLADQFDLGGSSSWRRPCGRSSAGCGTPRRSPRTCPAIP